MVCCASVQIGEATTSLTQGDNDEVGASAYDPRVMLNIVLLSYSRGLISSRKIEQACSQNVLFIAISGDSQPKIGRAHV